MFESTVQTIDKQLPLASAISQPAAKDTIAVFWLGQAGFAFRLRDRLIVIDPYLSDSLASKYKGRLFGHQRMMPSPLDPATALGLNLVLATHAHSDHFDGGTIPSLLAANPECRFICPKSAEEKAVELRLPADRLFLIEAGMKHYFGGVGVEAIPSAHEELEYNERGEHKYLGYVLEMGGIRLYHSGDCVPYNELAVELAKRRIDVAMLPVNGRDDFRRQHGVPGNFTIDEAAKLCLSAGIRFLIPHHFGMFEFNTAGVEEIHQRLGGCSVSGLSYWLPSVSECLWLKSIERYGSRRFPGNRG